MGEEELAFQENGQRGIRRKVFAPTAIFFVSLSCSHALAGERRVIKVIRRTLKPRGRPFSAHRPSGLAAHFGSCRAFGFFTGKIEAPPSSATSSQKLPSHAPLLGSVIGAGKVSGRRGEY